jgi:hypothetical protein
MAAAADGTMLYFIRICCITEYYHQQKYFKTIMQPKVDILYKGAYYV